MSSPIPENAADQLQHEGYLVFSLDEATGDSMTRVFELGQKFFRAPSVEKRASLLPHDCGYRPMGVEYSQSPERPDRMETFSVSARSNDGAAHLLSFHAARLHAQMVDMFNQFEQIAAELGCMMARQFNASETVGLRDGFRNWSRLQLNYSRPAMEGGHFINELHEDGGFLTIACATGPGLGIKLQNGTLLPVTASPPTVLIMPGEVTWLMSGGAIAPLYHHVQSTPTVAERMSLLLFADLDPKLCHPWVTNEINADVDIGARTIRNVERFGLHPFPTS